MKAGARRTRLDPRRAKLHRTYDVSEAAKLFDVHRNTVRNWIKTGLQSLPDGRSHLIPGTELRRYLSERRSQARTPCPPGTMYCLPCRAPRRPAGGEFEVLSGSGPTRNVRAICDACGRLIHRRVSLRTAEATGFGAQGRWNLDDSAHPSLNCAAEDRA